MAHEPGGLGAGEAAPAGDGVELDRGLKLPAAGALLLAGVLGLSLGQWMVAPLIWLVLAAACPWVGLGLGGVIKSWTGGGWLVPRRLGWWGVLAGVVCVHAGWAGVLGHWREDAPGIGRFVQEGGGGHIAYVEGVVTGGVRHVAADDGVFEWFRQKQASTRLVLEVDHIQTAGGLTPARGRALVSIRGLDERLEKGQRLGVKGWLLEPSWADNPGQEDYARRLQRSGIQARLAAKGQANVKVLAKAQPAQWLAWREGLKARADDALMVGIDPEEPAGRLTRALIIGTRDDRLYEISEPYRKTGLFHILSISGAHLSILLGLVWVLGRVVFANPARTVWLVLGVLACYLAVLPEEVPIVRSSLMVLGMCLGDLLARRMGASLGLLASAWVILMVRPQEVTGVGFELSYVGVMSLLWLTGPVDRLLAGGIGRLGVRGEWEGITQRGRVVVSAGRWVRLWAAANLAAWLGTLPVLAYEFGTINPLGWLWSLVSAPVVMLLLPAGFLKMVVGLVAPGLSGLFAPVVVFLAWLMNAGVGWAGEMPGTSVTLEQNASLAWLIAAGTVLVALAWGRFERRPVALLVSLALLTGWLFAGPWMRPVEARWDRPVAGAVLEVGALSVGEGSCFYVRVWEQGRPGGVMVFDAGSMSLGRVGRRTIAPCFNALGIERIDTLVISHGDLGSFSGVVDLADEIPVKQVVTTRYVIDEAKAQPSGSAGVLFDALGGLGKLRPPMDVAGREDKINMPGLSADVLWPAKGLARGAWKPGELSMVIRLAAGGRAVLLTGDLEGKGIAALEALKAPVEADIAQLPGFGGPKDRSGPWLVDVSPKVVMQSCDADALEDDPWPEYLRITGAKRLMTGRDGFVRVWVGGDGKITTQTFLSPIQGAPGRVDAEARE